MIKSMTGFGCKEVTLPRLGRTYVELRSINHKSLDIVFHLPEGFASLEDNLKKEIEAKLERGRVSCVINITSDQLNRPAINRPLLKNYLSIIKKIKQQVHTKSEISLDGLIHLPGVLSVVIDRSYVRQIWSSLKPLLNQALENLLKMREKEGRALYHYLSRQNRDLKSYVQAIQSRFKKIINIRVAKMDIDDERNSFLKERDVSEEVERLLFHIKNFQSKLSKAGPVGKELDFVAQEMQREANTIGAKSFDAVISSKIVRIKSQIERLREQLQNIE